MLPNFHASGIDEQSLADTDPYCDAAEAKRSIREAITRTNPQVLFEDVDGGGLAPARSRRCKIDNKGAAVDDGLRGKSV